MEKYKKALLLPKMSRYSSYLHATQNTSPSHV